MQVADDARWVEQDDEVLRQEAERVDAELRSLSQTEPVSATPKAARTTPTSTSARSAGPMTPSSGRVPSTSGVAEADHLRLRKQRAR